MAADAASSAGRAHGAPHLVLVGAGHAHLHLLRHAERLRRAGYRTTLVAPRWFEYSGVATAVATGGLDPAEGRIDVAALTPSGGPVDHLEGRVARLDPATGSLTTEAGEELSWDVLSLNVGSVADLPVEVDARDPAVLVVKPLTELARLRDLLVERGAGTRISVVGAGASGLELAGRLSARADVGTVTLLDAGPAVGGSLPAGAARRVRRLLGRRGVRVVDRARPAEVTGRAVVLADGRRVEHDLVVLATGLVPPPLARQPPFGGPGGVPVRATLQHRDHDDVYAAGDCAHFLPAPLPRLGVHGVRQGPVLLAALEARRVGDPAPVYRPPARALSVLDLGGGTALAVRGRWWWLGRSALLLKRAIDRRWLAGYRA